MNRQYVSSSDIRSVGYENSILEIEFHRGGIYQYSSVPLNVYQELMNAESHGQYFHRYIKNKYHTTKIV